MVRRIWILRVRVERASCTARPPPKTLLDFHAPPWVWGVQFAAGVWGMGARG